MSSVALKKKRISMLHDLGGAGKTQIMAKLVSEFGDQCDDHPPQLSLTIVISNNLNPHLGSGQHP